MKRIAWLLVVLLLLTACGTRRQEEQEAAPGETVQTEEPAPAAETPPAQEASPAPEAPAEPEEPETTAAYTTGEVNVRTAPSLDAEVAFTLAARTDVARIGDDGEFSAVLIDGEVYYIASEYLRERAAGKNGFLVAIDAGHQAQGNYDTEPIGPGANEQKIKVSSGTCGSTTGIPEYELTLQLSLKLQAELEARGYDVVMTRTTHDVDISNIERANVANDAAADAFIRVHANGSEDPSVSGALTICQTPGNPYNGDLYDACHRLSSLVLDELVAAAGCRKGYVWETDTMCGINWCRIPVTIVEVGYMTNPEEDVLLSTDEYQDKVVEGIANGIDAFLLGDSAAQ